MLHDWGQFSLSGVLMIVCSVRWPFNFLFLFSSLVHAWIPPSSCFLPSFCFHPSNPFFLPHWSNLPAASDFPVTGIKTFTFTWRLNQFPQAEQTVKCCSSCVLDLSHTFLFLLSLLYAQQGILKSRLRTDSRISPNFIPLRDFIFRWWNKR